MVLPFGPAHFELNFGTFYKMEREYKEDYPKEVSDVDMAVAAAVLQIAHCTPGKWRNKKEEVEVYTVANEMWDTYNVKYGEQLVYSLGESMEGYILHHEIYHNGWIDVVMKEAENLAERFGKM